MARVTGPFMSISASGTLAKVLTASIWKGRPYMRQRVIPANPRSAAQLGVRAMMAFLAEQWINLSTAQKASYEADATEKMISPFNQFCSANLLRWQVFDSPTMLWPAPEISTPLTVTTMTLTGGDGNVLVQLTPSGAGDIWGFIICRELAAITAPNWTNSVKVLEADAGNQVQWTDSPLDPATYHYRAAVINDDGITGVFIADDSAVVT